MKLHLCLLTPIQFLISEIAFIRTHSYSTLSDQLKTSHLRSDLIYFTKDGRIAFKMVTIKQFANPAFEDIESKSKAIGDLWISMNHDGETIRMTPLTDLVP